MAVPEPLATLSIPRQITFSVIFRRSPSGSSRIASISARKDLEGDVALQLGVAGAIHVTYPAGANQREDLVVPESRAGRKARVAGRVARFAHESNAVVAVGVVG